jgi:hypothetical protein
MQVYNSFQEMAAGQPGGTQSTMSVFNAFAEADKIANTLEFIREELNGVLDMAEQGQPLGSREYDGLKEVLVPAFNAVGKAVNMVSGKNVYV